nr:hypothetical protein TQ38_22525 [Novosphingobium sp. P6W]
MMFLSPKPRQHRLYAALKTVARAKSHHPSWRNLVRIASFRIAARASNFVHEHKRSEVRKLNDFASRESNGYSIKNGIDYTRSLNTRHLSFPIDGRP